MTGSGRSSASMDERSRHVGKRVGCAGIVSAAVVTLGLSVHHDLQITAAALGPASIRYQTATFRQEECLYHALRSEVRRALPFTSIVPNIRILSGWPSCRPCGPCH